MNSRLEYGGRLWVDLTLYRTVGSILGIYYPKKCCDSYAHEIKIAIALLVDQTVLKDIGC